MKYWKRVDEYGNIRTVESYSFDSQIEGALEITKEDFDAFIANLKPPALPPVRDLAKEIDELKLILAKHNIT
jgi:hypothetical protein